MGHSLPRASARSTICRIGVEHSAPYGALFPHKPNISTYVDRSLPCVSTAAPWRYDEWVPRVLILNIGTNDYILPVGRPSPITFAERWHALANHILSRYALPPVLIAVCGPMTQIQCPYVASAVARLQREGYNASMVNITLPGSPDALRGCGGHPTVADHLEMARRIVPAVQAATRWSVYHAPVEL